MFGSLGNFANLIKQAREIGPKLESLQSELRSRRVVGRATAAELGSATVEIELNALLQAPMCRIDPRLLEPGHGPRLETLVCEALESALGQAKQLHRESLQAVTGDLPIPGLGDMLAKFGGGTP